MTTPVAAMTWRSNGPPPREWVAATAAGLALGLAFGSAIVGYGTGLGELVVQGAICGLAIGAAQALVVTAATGGLPVRPATRAPRSAS